MNNLENAARTADGSVFDGEAAIKDAAEAAARAATRRQKREAAQAAARVPRPDKVISFE